MTSTTQRIHSSGAHIDVNHADRLYCAGIEQRPVPVRQVGDGPHFVLESKGRTCLAAATLRLPSETIADLDLIGE